MSVASEGDEPISLRERLGHLGSTWWYPLLFAGAAWSIAFPRDHRPTWAGIVYEVISCAQVAAMATYFLYHRNGMCVICMSNSPLVPTDEVDKKRRLLKLHHRVDGTPSLILMGVSLLAMVLAAWLVDDNRLFSIIALFFVLPMVGGSLLTRLHSRLYPWCPYCRRRRDDDDEETPAPTPEPSISK